MKILITNDDGIDTLGIRLLAEWAKKLGEVTVVAPKTGQSAKSHAIEIVHAVEIKKVDFMDGIKMKRVTELLRQAQGDCPVYIYCEADKKSYCAPEYMWIEPENEIIKQLTAILGDGNVKIIEKG